jgi:hypothetical protein
MTAPHETYGLEKNIIVLDFIYQHPYRIIFIVKIEECQASRLGKQFVVENILLVDVKDIW